MKRSTFLIIFLLILLLGGAGYTLEWSPLFTVKAVKISQINLNDQSFDYQKFVSNSLDTNGLHIKLHEPIARVNTGAIYNLLSGNKYLEKISIARSWQKGEINIELKFRVPIASISTIDGNSTLGGKNLYIDQSGTIFASPLNYGTLPAILLPQDNEISASNKNNSEINQVITKLIPALPIQLINSLISISIPSVNQIQILSNLRKPSLAITYGDSSALALKGEVALKLLSLKENRYISTIDLTDPVTPTVTYTNGHLGVSKSKIKKTLPKNKVKKK